MVSGGRASPPALGLLVAQETGGQSKAAPLATVQDGLAQIWKTIELLGLSAQSSVP